MSGYLPCGVTDSMCEPDDPRCGNCGCPYSNHYYADGDEPMGNMCARESDAEGIELDSNGQVTHACDSLMSYGKSKRQCPCEGFIEGEYEPDYDEDDWR